MFARNISSKEEFVRVVFCEAYTAGLYGNQKATINTVRLLNAHDINASIISLAPGQFATEVSRLNKSNKTYRLGRFLHQDRLGRFRYLYWPLIIPALLGLNLFLLTSTIFRRADIVHCQNIRSCISVLPAAILMRKSVILNIKGYVVEPAFAQILCARFVRNILVISENLVKIQSKLPIFFHCVPEVLPICNFDFPVVQRARHRDYQRPFQVVYVGSMNESKGIFRLLSVASMLCEKGYHLVEFNLVGEFIDAETRRRFLSEVEQRSLTNIKVHGYVSNMASLLENMDLHLHLSDSDGVPRSILESACCGLPAVGFDVGGVGDVITHGRSGFVVEIHDLHEVCRCITCFYDDADFYGRCSVEAIRLAKTYDQKNYLAKLTGYYNDVTRQRY